MQGIQQVRLLREFGAFTSFTSRAPTERMKLLAVEADQYHAADGKNFLVSIVCQVISLFTDLH